MRTAIVSVHGKRAGVLVESDDGIYNFTYDENYDGAPVSLTMPLDKKVFEFKAFPPFFDGLLPEGFELEALLKKYKIDRHDYFQQLLTVGADLVGAVTVEKIE